MSRAAITMRTAMKRGPLRAASRRSSNAAQSRWKALACEDGAGIDGDIEGLLDLMQQAQGGSRALASNELIRRLSFAA